MGKWDDSDQLMLLQKYAGGRIPPLVDVNDPAAGLIHSDLLRIYHRGLRSLHSIRLGILLMAPGANSLYEKWFKGYFGLNEWAREDWPSFCKTLRKREAGEQACDSCDRYRAVMAEREGRAIAYLCANGLIDFAVPVSVMGQVIAVLLSGQCQPQPGRVWNPELIQPNGCFRPLEPGEVGVDAWSESQQRINAIEQATGLSSGTLLERLQEDVASQHTTQITPAGVEAMLNQIQLAGQLLSDLASLTFERDKSNLVGWIRGQIAGSLKPLSSAPAPTHAVWQALSVGLGYMACYFGLDYALILACDGNLKERQPVLCQFGLPEGQRWNWDDKPGVEEALSRLRNTVRGQEKFIPLVLKDYVEIPLFAWLRERHARRGTKTALAASLVATAEDVPPLLILGRFDQDVDPETLLPIDRAALTSIVGDISLVAEVVMLVERLRQQARQRTRFIQDVAHELYNPMQNIIVQAIRLDTAPVSEVWRLARGLVADVRRLQRTSERVWALENIDQAAYAPERTEWVNVHQVVMNCRKSLAELAEEQGIEIQVDPDLSKCPKVRVNKELLVLSIQNLIDNAVKYSRPKTTIRIEGKPTAEGMCLSVGNRGIQIQPEDFERIFERNYRTKEARLHRPEGTGIGLCLVKAFADRYGGIEVRSTPIEGTRDYLTVFKLTIRERSY